MEIELDTETETVTRRKRWIQRWTNTKTDRDGHGDTER